MKKLLTIIIIFFSHLVFAQQSINDNTFIIKKNGSVLLSDSLYFSDHTYQLTGGLIPSDTASILLTQIKAGNAYQVKGSYYTPSDTTSILLTQIKAGNAYQTKGNYVLQDSNPKWKGRTVTTTQTLTKSDNIIYASGDINLTLPSVTAADSNLSITVKNIGTYTDLVTVVGTIDGTTNSMLTRWRGRTYIVDKAGDWVIKEKETRADNLLDVSSKGSWTTVAEVVAYLNEHITTNTVVRLGGGSYSVSATQVLNFPYIVTFEGLSYAETKIIAATGLAGKPMFRCNSEVHFKMLFFDAATLSNYGKSNGEDAIRIVGAGTYHEIKDCSFNRFNTGVVDSTNGDLWFFEVQFDTCYKTAILMNSAVSGGTIKTGICKFNNCRRAIDLSKGTAVNIILEGSTYVMGIATDSGLILRPTTCTLATQGYFKGNIWNNTGVFVSGINYNTSSTFANIYDEGNAGRESYSPHFKVNALNSTDTTRLLNNATWYKVHFTGTVVENCKWTIATGSTANKVTYQPNNHRAVWMLITGNFSCDASNKTFNYGICKNGIKTTRYGEQTVRYTVTSGQNQQFSCFVYLENVAPTDYFELYWNGGSNGDVLTLSDLSWGSWTQ